MKRIQLLEELAQRTYEEWFVKFRIPGMELKMDEESGLPVGWEFGSIGNLIGFQSGFAYKSSKFVDDGFPVIKIKNIGNNRVDFSSTNFIDQKYADATEKFQLEPGNLLIAMTGATVGKVGYVPFSNNPGFLNQRVGRFQNLNDSNNTHFIFCLFSQGNGLSQIINLAGGAAQPNISGDQILSVKTVIPQNELLSKFNDSVSSNFDLILKLENQNKLLKESRDILLPRLMSGMISVEEAELGMVAEEREEYNIKK